MEFIVPEALRRVNAPMFSLILKPYRLVFGFLCGLEPILEFRISSFEAVFLHFLQAASTLTCLNLR